MIRNLAYAMPILTTACILIGVIVILMMDRRKNPTDAVRDDTVTIIKDVPTNDDAPEPGDRIASLVTSLAEQGMTLHTDLSGCTEP